MHMAQKTDRQVSECVCGMCTCVLSSYLSYETFVRALKQQGSSKASFHFYKHYEVSGSSYYHRLPQR